MDGGFAPWFESTPGDEIATNATTSGGTDIVSRATPADAFGSRSIRGAGGTALRFRPVRLHPAVPRSMALEPSGAASPGRAESGASEPSVPAAGVEAVAP